MFIDPTREIVIFARLAQAFKNRLQMQDRDRALVMTGVCASMLEMEVIANFCRRLILKNNPGHMIKRCSKTSPAQIAYRKSGKHPG